MQPEPSIRLIVSERALPLFFPLLSGGVFVDAPAGSTLREVVCGRLGVSDDYLDNRVQTLFLDGKAVDDPDEVRVSDGGRVALSAAMPGLLGAVLRKGGHLSAMRKQITCETGECEDPAGDSRVTVALFNLAARELGPGLLASGIRLSAAGLTDRLAVVDGEMALKGATAELDGHVVDFARLSEALAASASPDGPVRLRIALAA